MFLIDFFIVYSIEKLEILKLELQNVILSISLPLMTPKFCLLFFLSCIPLGLLCLLGVLTAFS